MLDFLSKLIFFFKRPKIIVVTGKGRFCAAEAIFRVLEKYFEVAKIEKIDLKSILRNEILILESEIKEVKDLNFFVKKSKLPILVVTHIGEIPSDFILHSSATVEDGQDFFAGEKEDVKEILKLAKFLPERSNLILNFDDETVREIKDLVNLRALTFGFQEGADFRATDVKFNSGTNFKINYEGNIVPIWLDKLFGKEQIYSALSAISVGIILDLNLVEVSQALKNYKSLPGKMRLIKGIKSSLILDDSESASVFSMIEAIEILGKIDIEGLAHLAPPPFLKERGFGRRRIAVLGDILGIGKYTIEAHETIGEKVVKNANLLFTVGPRAKFIVKGAIVRGMPEEKIFQFDEIEEVGITLQNEIKKGDLILVDGSTEMKMEKIVEEIKAFY